MSEFVHWKNQGAIARRLQAAHESARPGSRAMTRFYGDLVKIIKADNTEKLERSVDRYGKPLARLARSTLRRRRQSDKPLMRRGSRSRFVTNFECNVSIRAGTATLRAGWRDLGGAAYNLTGAKKAGTKWRLPKRDVGGITPRGWRRILDRHRQLPGELRKYGGGRS